MFLEIGRPCKSAILFDVPHKPEPMTFKQLAKEFPEFVKIFDGKAIENTMCFYWKRNKQTGVYEFIDADSEEEVAELMNVELYTGTVGDEEGLELAEQRQLTQDEIASFKEELAFVKEALETSGFKK
jgi:hypothetical protein